MPDFKKDLTLSAVAGFLCGLLVIPYFKIMKKTDVDLMMGALFIVSFSILAPIGMISAIWIGKKIKIIYQIAKFILVGLLNTLVDGGILALLIVLTGISQGWAYTGFKGISFIFASVNSYFWNKAWTFKKKTADTQEGAKAADSKEVFQFFIVSLIGFGLNLSIATFLVNVWGVHFGFNPDQWGLLSALAGTALGLIWNFVGYKLVVFRD